MESKKQFKKVLVVGGGLAGSEASYFLASKGIPVFLAESKEINPTPAQKTTDLAELVCTNSLKSEKSDSPHGILKTEMKALGSLVLTCAQKTRVPAGDALAVDRELFGKAMSEVVKSHPLITYIKKDVNDPLLLAQELDCQYVILATGPLPSKGMEKWLQDQITGDDLYFYDAIAPVVDADTLDMDKLYFKDRHADTEGGDYLNAPMNKEQYYAFIEALREAQKVAPKNFEEERFFESCLPIDLMAQRGVDTPRYSCMKPIGLRTPDGQKPFAVVQLRKENLLGEAYNLVGFQTRLTYPEQKRVFRMIPGLENATFLHLGSVHRNTYIHAQKYLNWDMSFKKYPNMFVAGQMTGVEGYTESAASGLYVAHQLLQKIEGEASPKTWPAETAIGALINYIMTALKPVPSNINMGLFSPPQIVYKKGCDRKKLKRKAIADRARIALENHLCISLEPIADLNENEANV